MSIISHGEIDEFVYSKIQALIDNGYKINAKKSKTNKSSMSEYSMEVVLDDIKYKDSNISIKIVDKINKDTRDISYIVMWFNDVAYTTNNTYYKINNNLYTNNKDELSVYVNKFNKKDNVNSNYTSSDFIDNLFNEIIF